MTRRRPNYIAWTIVLTVGIAAGNLIATGIKLLCAWLFALLLTASFTYSWTGHHGQKPDAADHRRAHNENRTGLDTGTRRHALQATDPREQRRQSPTGIELTLRCKEWSDNYKKTKTETIRLNRDYYCDRLNRYLNGQLSAPKPAN